MRYQAILFDIDGTLVNSFPTYLKAMLNTLAKYSRTASVNQLKRTFSMSLIQAFNYLKIPKDMQSQFEADYLSEKALLRLKPTLFPGINSMFRGLEQDLLPGLGIVTSGGDQEVNDLVRNFTFMKKVWVTVTADTTPYHKPAPEPLLTAVDRMGISPKHALYIG